MGNILVPALFCNLRSEGGIWDFHICPWPESFSFEHNWSMCWLLCPLYWQPWLCPFCLALCPVSAPLCPVDQTRRLPYRLHLGLTNMVLRPEIRGLEQEAAGVLFCAPSLMNIAVGNDCPSWLPFLPAPILTGRWCHHSLPLPFEAQGVPWLPAAAALWAPSPPCWFLPLPALCS